MRQNWIGKARVTDRAESPFCVAVQWRPENFWRTGEFHELFQGLVQAANQRKKQPAANRYHRPP